MINFKTYDEQIEILQNRGMIINNTTYAKELLKQNNYYNLINGYKDIFIVPGIHPDKYISGVTFEEIYALHQFDKELRHNLSHMLIIIEREFSSILAYEFSRNHKNHDLDYLDPKNYDTTGLKVLEVSQLITDGDKGLNSTLIKSVDSGDKMICHYRNNYSRVPLWVFVNILSFGTLSKMYKLMQPRERDAIAKSIGQVSKKTVYADDIQKAINVMVLLRNKCAHDNRIYDFDPGKTTIKWNDFLSSHLTKSDNKNTLFGAFSCASLFFEPTIFNAWAKLLKKKTKEFLITIHSIPTSCILKKMGIPQSFLL